MSIEQNWKQLNEQDDEDLSSLLQPGRIEKMKSSDPLQKIKSRLLMTIGWTILISALYIFVIIFFPYWQVILSIGAVLLFTVWGGCTAYIRYRRIGTSVSANSSLLTEMERHHKSISDWMKYQLKVAVFIYPVAVVGGFMVGAMVGRGKGIEFLEEFMTRPRVIISLVVSMIIMVPCGIYLGKWLLAKSFGKYLIVLEKNIEELKAEK